MASFTDEIVQFNPYIQTLPVEDMVQVGMLKQQQYDQGVQKVQAQIDSIANIDVMKDEHKLYLQKRLGQLETEVNKVVGADFSKTQLVSSIGGLTRQIATDKIVQNAMISTQVARKGQQALNEARTTGKGYGVENEYAFNKQLSDWLGDKNAETSFSGSYVPYTDVKKKLLDVIKTVDGDSTLTQMPFVTDTEGNIQMKDGQPVIDGAMVQRSIKGKDPTKLINAIHAALDENDLRQLGISGQYHYRNYTPEDMKKMVDSNTKAKGDQLAAQKDLLRVAINNATPEDKEHLEDQMSLLDEKLGGLNKEYVNSIKSLSADPEGFKQQFYTENMVTGLGSAFSSQEKAETYLKNPKFEAYMDEEKLKISQQELAIKKEELAIKKQEAANKTNKTDKDKPNDQSLGANPVAVDTENTIYRPNEFTFTTETQDVISQRDGLIASAIRTDFSDEELINAAKREGKDPDVKRKELFMSYVDKYKKGESIKDELVSTVQRVLELDRDIDTRKNQMKNVLNEADKRYPQFVNTNLAEKVQPMKVGIRINDEGFWQGGRPVDVDLAPEDLVNLAVINENTGFFGTWFTSKAQDDRAKLAMAAIRKKFSPAIAEELISKSQPGDMAAYGGDVRKAIKSVGKVLNTPAYEERQKFIEDSFLRTGRVGQPVGFDLQTGKPEVLRDVQGSLTSILQDASRLGGGPPEKSEALSKAFAKEGAAFRVEWQPKGELNEEKFRLIVLDKDAEGATIDITKQRAEQLTGRVFDSQLNAIETKIKTTTNLSTNETGKPEDSFLHKWDFKKLRKYNVNGDVSQDMLNPDQFFLKLHIYDKDKGKFITQNVRMADEPGVGVNLNQLQGLMNTLSDAAVEQMLLESKKAQSE